MADSSSGRVTKRKRHSRPIEFVIRLVKEKPLGTVGAVITLLFLFTAIFADLLAPYGMNELAGTPLIPPGPRYWLGTDNLGRDMLSRVIFGARISVVIGLAAPTVAAFISGFIGMTSGYIGGKFDLIVQRFVDAVMCLPTLPVVMVIVTLVGPGFQTLIIVMGVVGGIRQSRGMRGIILSYKNNMYVEAGKAVGCSTPRILTRHLLPNVMPFIITAYTTAVPGVIITEASLSFLGFGIPPPSPSWGGMLSGPGRTNMFMAPWMAIWPGLALSIVVYGISMFGDALRDILDPRLRGGLGRYGVKVKKGAKK
ncbi:Oligopeptide transport system permease protein OppC [subsurface metagenome]